MGRTFARARGELHRRHAGGQVQHGAPSHARAGSYFADVVIAICEGGAPSHARAGSYLEFCTAWPAPVWRTFARARGELPSQSRRSALSLGAPSHARAGSYMALTLSPLACLAHLRTRARGATSIGYNAPGANAAHLRTRARGATVWMGRPRPPGSRRTFARARGELHPIGGAHAGVAGRTFARARGELQLRRSRRRDLSNGAPSHPLKCPWFGTGGEPVGNWRPLSQPHLPLLPQPHTGPAAILGDKFHAGRFQGGADRG